MSKQSWGLVGVLALSLVVPAAAAEPAAQPSVKELAETVQALQAKLKDYENRIAQLENRPASSVMTKDEIVKLVNDLNADAAKRSALPSWMENLKFGGDLRLRMENISYHNVDTKDRNRARYRLRFGFIKTFLDNDLEIGFRLASGEDGYKNARNQTVTGYSSPTSTNQSFDTFFTQKPIWVDLAYAKYTPKTLKGFTIEGGKMKKDFVHTDLVWDSDLNPEGIWAQYKPKVSEAWSPFVNAGYFSVDEQQYGHDVTLAMYQVGSDLNITKDVNYVVAATMYDYDHFRDADIYGNGNHQNSTTGQYYVRGFRTFNLTNQIKWKMFNLPWVVYHDYVHNCEDQDSIHPYEDQSDGFAMGLGVGQNKKKGDWSLGYKYAYIEANSTPGAFNDADFGGTNRKGHSLRAVYNLTDFLEFGASVFLTEPVVGSAQDQRTLAIQGDLVWKF